MTAPRPWRRRRRLLRTVLLVVWWSGAGGAANAQDTAPALPSGPGDGAAVLLERALPAANAASAIECGATRWFALPDLETRALALLAAVRTVRVAAGIAQTGDVALGWNTAALALGSAGEAGGLALRVAARHERSEGALSARALAAGAGIEVGGGGWLALGRGLRAWASAPQLATSGEAPPLARPLQLGVRADGAAAAAWLAVDAPVAGSDGSRLIGGELSAGPLALWAEGRDGPWRASVGVRARRGVLTLTLRVDAHPELPETTRLWIALSPPRRGESQP